jgi:hypothetical protein
MVEEEDDAYDPEEGEAAHGVLLAVLAVCVDVVQGCEEGTAGDLVWPVQRDGLYQESNLKLVYGTHLMISGYLPESRQCPVRSVGSPLPSRDY